MTDVIEINNEDIIDNFDKILKTKNTFSENVDLDTINAYIFYVDNDELENYKKYQVQINNNTITKKELTTIILNNNSHYSKKYDLIGIYKYCFNLNSENLKDFCLNQNNYDFLEKYNKIQNIPFDKTIDVFQTNNSIILIFKYDSGKKKDVETTSRTNSEPNKKSSKNKTHKQVRFNLKQSNKTLKKTI